MPTHAKINVPNLGELEIPTGIFINNEWVEPEDGKTFETVDPSTGKKLIDVAHAQAADVDKAVKAARKAFKGEWKKVPAAQRGVLLNKLAALMERDADKIAAVESLNSGKGVRMARYGDVLAAVGALKYFAGLSDKVHGQTMDHFGSDKLAYTLHQPIGVCGQIIPWNYPLIMWAWKIGPALAAGCTVVMKPSELTPLTALMMCDLIKEAGIPAGVVNTVPGLGATAGEAIARHPDIDKVAFTGSVITGRKISIAAAETNLKKVTLELGGKSPMLVFDSADVEEAAVWTARGIWFNSGQTCSASSRVLVQEGIYDKYLEALKNLAAKTAIGQPSDQATSFGPLISQLQRDKVMAYIESGKQEGARVVCGGNKWDKSNGGFWVEPTILADGKPDMKVTKEEIFGPVVVVTTFKTEEEALELANDTSYGLAAAVFTENTRQANRVAAGLDAGTVWINEYGSVATSVPFGGFKQSGIGRELGTYGLEAYIQVKSVHNNLSSGKVSWPM